MKRAATVAITVVALAGAGSAASAAWTGTTSGVGSAQSDSMPSATPTAPTTSISGTTVTINFLAVSTVSQAHPATSYVMTRYSAGTGGSVIGASFTCTRPAACTDVRPEGSATHYTYTPKWGNGWTGIESSRSEAATVPVAVVAPAAADVQGTPGGLAANNGKPTQLDVIKLTFNKVVAANSVMAGFTGDATSVTVAFAPEATSDVATVIGTNLGTITLGSPDYVQGSGGSGNYSFTASTMTMETVAGKSVVTLTLGVVNHPTRPFAIIGTPTMSWATTTSITDGTTNATTGTADESGAADADF